jgi:hypothetical protein
VALDGTLLLVGARHDEISGRRSGSMYVYRRDEGGNDNWGFLEQLIPSAVDTDDEFGYALAFRQGTAAVGARRDDDLGKRFGAAYVYRFRFNNPPILVSPIPGPEAPAVIGEPFAYTVPPDTFADPDLDETISLEAFLLGGMPLSDSWLEFDPATGAFSGIPDVNDEGTLSVVVTGIDSDGASVPTAFDIEVVVVAAQTFSELAVAGPQLRWVTSYFSYTELAVDGNHGIWRSQSDPDQDGLSNLHEYAFGGNPNSADAGRVDLMIERVGQFVTLHFLRRLNDPRLHYVVETSDDLLTWHPIELGSAVTSTGLDSEEFERVSVWFDSAESGLLQFFRVRLE